jgi:hypothetical protein
MVSVRPSISSVSPELATQVAMGAGRKSAPLTNYEMSSAKATLPPRSQSVRVGSDAQQQIRFQEDSLRSTIIERLPTQSDDAFDEVQSSRSTVIKRVVSDATDVQAAGSADAKQKLADSIEKVKQKGLNVKDIAANVEKAKSVSVDPAKRNFWQKFGGAVVSLGVVALFTALTISTGGAAAIVGLSVAGLMLAKNAGDTYCAYKVLQNKNAEARGEAPPYKNVPMGADWIGNMCHSALSSFHKDKIASGEMSADDIKAKAKNWSLGINIALKVVSFSAGGVTGIASGAAWLPRVGSIAFSAATLAIATVLDKVKQNNEQWGKQYADEKLPEHFLKLCDQYEQLINQAEGANPELRNVILANIEDGLNTLMQDLDQLQERLESTQHKLENPSSASRQAVQGGLAEGLVFAGGVQGTRRALELLPAVKAAGMNFESAASSLMMFKSAYDCWSMMRDQAQRTQTLGIHTDSIFNIKQVLEHENTFASRPDPSQLA